MEAVWRKFSHRPGNPATVVVVRWTPLATLQAVGCADLYAHSSFFNLDGQGRRSV